MLSAAEVGEAVGNLKAAGLMRDDPHFEVCFSAEGVRGWKASVPYGDLFCMIEEGESESSLKLKKISHINLHTTGKM